MTRNMVCHGSIEEQINRSLDNFSFVYNSKLPDLTLIALNDLKTAVIIKQFISKFISALSMDNKVSH